VRNITATGKQSADFWRLTVEDMFFQANWPKDDKDFKIVLDYLLTNFLLEEKYPPTVPPASASPARSGARPAAAASAQGANLLPDAPGRDTVLTRCGSCHSVRNITTTGKQSADFWKITVEDMFNRANWPKDDPDAKIILDYLLANFLLKEETPAPAPRATSAGAAPPAQENVRRLEGRIIDRDHLPVVGANVTVTQRGGDAHATAISSTDGFHVDGLVPAVYDVRVEAAGFTRWEGSVDLRRAGVAPLEATLQPQGVSEQIVVTPTRSAQRLNDVPASVHVVTREEIAQSPAVVADDVLRQVPTFSLFRRTSSLASHPTTQGVSLRGIGPSGVSRTLVLIDNVPFNDPFGGWVYWTRVPLESIDHIEVVNGLSSSLYGNYAMGGVINIIPSHPTRRTLELKPQYGSRNSPKIDVFGADRWGKVGLVADGGAFDTEGYGVVDARERGPVDNKAAVNFRNANVKLDYDPTDRLTLFVRGGYFREDRDNGKISTIDGTEEANDTTWKAASGGLGLGLPDESQFQARLFTDFVTLRSNFLAVPAATPARSIGRMTLNQRVPTKSLGGMAQWAKAVSRNQFLTLGTDWRWVEGDSHEDALDAVTGTQVTLRRVSGGRQRSVGMFVQDMLTPTANLQLTLNARIDRWRNYDGHNLETTAATGLPTPNNQLLPDRDDTVASPRIAALYRLTERVTAWGDLGWGFRAPTLNELYRQFRVGNVLTLANDQLGPERMVGGEAGLNVTPARNVTWRTTWFDNSFRDPVSNVTLSIVGQQITRRRQNLGKTRIQGVQTDLEYRAGAFWRISGGYLFNHGEVREYPADSSLIGKLLPQVPRHRGSIQVSYSSPRYATIALQTQFVGAQFDDDQNRFELARYATADVFASRAVRPGIELFVGVQNLFATVYYVGTNPTTIGTPRLVNGGMRFRFGS